MSSDGEALLSPDEIDRVVKRLGASIVDEALRTSPGSTSAAEAQGAERLGLVGIRRGGVPVAQALARWIEAEEGCEVPVGTIDIALYRDDASTALPDPKIGPSRIDFDVRGRDVILVDDVLQTGRTVRAAIECLLDYGRPRRIWLAVLLDRGGRELPIAPDFVGRVIEVPAPNRVRVELGDDGQLLGAYVVAPNGGGTEKDGSAER